MGIKRKLNKYVDEMNIPSAKDVLPEEVLREDEKNSGKVYSMGYRKYICIAGMAACAVIVAAAVWKPWDNSKISDNEGNLAGDIAIAENNSGSTSNEAHKENTTSAASAGSTSGDKEYGDGVIGENKGDTSSGKDFAYSEDMCMDEGWIDMEGGYLSGEEMAPGMAAEEGVPSMDPTMAADEGEPSDAINGIEYSAGVLTGGEIRDLKNWDNYLRAMSDSFLRDWNMVLKNRTVVYVHNGEKPLSDVHVRIMQNDIVLYEAVTDVSGYAYLFYQYKTGDQYTPDSVQVQSSDGSWNKYEYSSMYENGQPLSVELSHENAEVKLDLMYVVDTTGSMQDELDYLKAEIQDVIERAGEQTGAQIRTSVNFYRDEGDEYVVKYYDFREDANEVAALVSEQYAAGGGDMPEAVHTALDNAINQHSWSDEASVKLMFLVLDAPPHDDQEIKDQILSLTEEAAKKGIRIIPVAASGADLDTQQLLRSMAVMTGGTYIFIDDNSGIGFEHTEPVKPEEYTSEYLNEMMIRIIGEYCGITTEINEVETTGETQTTDFSQE